MCPCEGNRTRYPRYQRTRAANCEHSGSTGSAPNDGSGALTSSHSAANGVYPVHEQIAHAGGKLVGSENPSALTVALGIENHDIGQPPFNKASALLQPENAGGLARHAMHGLLRRDQAPFTDHEAIEPCSPAIGSMKDSLSQRAVACRCGCV